MAAPSQSTVRPAGWQTREALQRDSAAAPGRDVVLVGHELPAVVGHLAVLAHLLEPLVAQVLWERVEGRGVGVCDGPRAITRAVPSAGSGGGTLAGVGGKSKWRATGFDRARAAVRGVGRNPPPPWRWPLYCWPHPSPHLAPRLPQAALRRRQRKQQGVRAPGRAQLLTYVLRLRVGVPSRRLDLLALGPRRVGLRHGPRGGRRAGSHARARQSAPLQQPFRFAQLAAAFALRGLPFPLGLSS